MILTWGEGRTRRENAIGDGGDSCVMVGAAELDIRFLNSLGYIQWVWIKLSSIDEFEFVFTTHGDRCGRWRDIGRRVSEVK